MSHVYFSRTSNSRARHGDELNRAPVRIQVRSGSDGNRSLSRNSGFRKQLLA